MYTILIILAMFIVIVNTAIAIAFFMKIIKNSQYIKGYLVGVFPTYLVSCLDIIHFFTK
jgi:hypothetical protein